MPGPRAALSQAQLPGGGPRPGQRPGVGRGPGRGRHWPGAADCAREASGPAPGVGREGFQK